MKTATKKGMRTGKVRSKFNDEFEKYLKAQCLKTTFNGLELETFSWYKKVLGLVQCLLNKTKSPVKTLCRTFCFVRNFKMFQMFKLKTFRFRRLEYHLRKFFRRFAFL